MSSYYVPDGNSDDMVIYELEEIRKILYPEPTAIEGAEVYYSASSFSANYLLNSVVATDTESITSGDYYQIVNATNTSANISYWIQNLSIYTEIINNDTITLSIEKAANASETAQVNSSTLLLTLPANITTDYITDNSNGQNLSYSMNYYATYNEVNITLDSNYTGDLINLTYLGRTPTYFIEVLENPPRIPPASGVFSVSRKRLRRIAVLKTKRPYPVAFGSRSPWYASLNNWKETKQRKSGRR